MNNITMHKYIGFNPAAARAIVAKTDAGEKPLISYKADARGKVLFWCLPEELALVLKACNQPSA
jgi:hypothetical protein